MGNKMWVEVLNAVLNEMESFVCCPNASALVHGFCQGHSGYLESGSRYIS